MTKIEEYDLILRAKDIATILKVSKQRAYEMMEETGFPLIRKGRLKRVQRDSFFQWLDQQEEMSS
ncbi:putative DNA-binding transcriptional regulator AlpA [Croceifilum oryzae]|uniref:DNA-binding transcriptional regulator AlpA n=1 Tax=Croceifilum oryzae TaxID=1553429 RepID=A0AAJ1TQ60_9BACL|nr:helix-turn-helix domain-containing protein [Croceifilum oryzae]MDQ0418486.1 putative DNA-binding transcriptional regulator AlpA [Croceifilum oryzae]